MLAPALGRRRRRRQRVGALRQQRLLLWRHLHGSARTVDALWQHERTRARCFPNKLNKKHPEYSGSLNVIFQFHVFCMGYPNKTNKVKRETVQVPGRHFPICALIVLPAAILPDREHRFKHQRQTMYSYAQAEANIPSLKRPSTTAESPCRICRKPSS